MIKEKSKSITVNMQNISSIVFCFFVLLIRMPASNDFSSGIYILSLRDLVVSRQAESVVQDGCKIKTRSQSKYITERGELILRAEQDVDSSTPHARSAREAPRTSARLRYDCNNLKGRLGWDVRL